MDISWTFNEESMLTLELWRGIGAIIQWPVREEPATTTTTTSQEEVHQEVADPPATPQAGSAQFERYQVGVS